MSQTFRIRGTQSRMTSVKSIAALLGYGDNDFVRVVDFALPFTSFVMRAARRSALVVTEGGFGVDSMATIPDIEGDLHKAIDGRDGGDITGREFRDRAVELMRHAYAKGLAGRALKEGESE